MNKVKWGVISTADIGLSKVLPAMKQGQHCELVGIASRNLSKAQEAASQLEIPKSYGSYEALLADPEIEAVYNPLPNHLHVPWSIKAIEAGKHVLCEKPIAMNSVEAQQLLDVAAQHPGVKVMEAFMYRRHPQWIKAKELVQSGEIGQVKTIQSFFSYFNDDPHNIRNIAAFGGGGLMDIGCYNISLSRFIFDAEPKRILGLIDHDPNFNTDRIASAILDFGAVTSTFTCSTQLADYQRVNIYGTTGRVELEIPFNAPPDRPTKLWHQTGADRIEQMTFEVCDQYTLQGDLFSQAILNNTEVPTPLDDALANMKVIEAIVESAKTNAWISNE